MDLEDLLGQKVPRDEDGLNQMLAYVKGDVESLDEQNDSVSIEVKDSNHPDIWSVEGIARALRTHLGLAKPKAPILSGKSVLRVTIDRRLGPIRPFIATSIINSNDLGKVSTDTKNILVEVTGTNAKTVGNTLKIVVAALAERGGKIYSCAQTYMNNGAKPVITPDLRSSFKEFSVSYANRILGASFKPAEMIRAFVRAGHPARQVSKDILRVESLCYRIDIMHQVDLVEDLAIALDINKLDPEWPRIWTLGGLALETERNDTLAEIMS